MQKSRNEPCAERHLTFLRVLFAALFILWAFVPTNSLHAYGITYYPSKHWATALPAWCCLAMMFTYIAYER